jgi:arylformamidase
MKEREIYDVSLPIYPGMTVYPGDPPVTIERYASLDRGDAYTASQLKLGSHNGTHLDAPSHLLKGGAGIDSILPEVLVGRARLFQLKEIDRIDRPVLEKLDLGGVSRILFGTPNSALLKEKVFCPDYVYITREAAGYLVEKGVRLVGLDYLSIEDFRNKDFSAHLVLLRAGVVIVEGLDLNGVPAGDYEIFCLPLKVKGCDGAPARVFLREME